MDRGEVAGVEILRRVQWVAVTLAFGLALWLGWLRGLEAALSLTVAASVSIVSLRSLEAAVRRLRVEADGSASSGGTGFSLRWTLLLVVLSITLILGLRDALALLIGFSVLPLAAIIEAGIQVCKPRVSGSSSEETEIDGA